MRPLPFLIYICFISTHTSQVLVDLEGSPAPFWLRQLASISIRMVETFWITNKRSSNKFITVRLRE